MFKQRISLNLAFRIHEFPLNEEKSQGDAYIIQCYNKATEYCNNKTLFT